MKFNLKTILLLCLFINTLMAQEDDKITLQLQWKHQFEFAGFYAAKEKGFYEEVGLDVEFKEFNSNMNIVDEVLKGNAKYGLSYSSLIKDYMQNKPLIFVANFFKQSPLVLVTQKDIKTPTDLKGKKVMGLLDSSHKQTILTMLEKFDMTADDFINLPQTFNMESFITKDVDAVSVFTTNEIYTLEKRGIQYNILDPAAFGTKFYDINLFTTNSELKNNPKRVDDFRNATIKGWQYALKHKEELADLIIEKYNTQNKSKEALLFEAKQIEYLMLTNIYPMGSIDIERVQMIADSIAQSLLVPKISKEKLAQFIYKTQANTLEFNQKQKQYLANKKLIKMCVDPNWMPLEKIENGKHIGVAADFLSLISKKIDTPIQLITTQDWSQSLIKVQNKQCDILALAEKTPSRAKYLNFTTPYVKVPLVIATKKGQPFVDNLNRVKEKPLGIVKNYSKYELLKAQYPEINLVEVASIQEGLEYVEEEKIFGFLDNALVINNEIQKNTMNDNIVISGQFPQTSYLSIASRNDEPILGDILEKVLSSIDAQTKDDIINKWRNITYQTKTDYELLLQILFFTFVLISIFIYWNLKLKQEMKSKELAQKELRKAKQELEKLNNSLEEKIKLEISKNTKHQVMLMHQSKLAQMGEMIENIAHQWRQPLAQINSSVLLVDIALVKNRIEDTMVEEKLLEIESLTAYMSKTIDDFKNFFNPNKQKTLFSIEDAIEKSYDIVKGTIRSNHIEVAIDIDKNLKCYCYLDELQQVILTLLNNAIDALITQAIKLPKIYIKAYEQEKNIIIEIQDNALGIDSEIINKIFEPYFTTKHKSQGTGLGLYMAKMILESGLEGSLNVENRLDGACFTIEVPQGKV